MKKQIHIRIDSDIDDILNNKAKKEKKSKSKVYNEVVLSGLNMSDLFIKISQYEYLLNKMYSNIYYIKKLLQQGYSDLNLEKTNPLNSSNLNEFNKSFRKGDRMND